MIAAQSVEILRGRVELIFFTLVVTVISTLIFSLLSPNKFTANATFVVNFKETSIGDSILQTTLADSYMGTQIDIVRSPGVAEKVMEKLKLDEDPGWADALDVNDQTIIRQSIIEYLLENLEVVPSRESRIVNLSFTAEDPNFAATVANSFVQAYIETNLDLSVSPAHRSAEWFNQELARLRSQLQTAQEKLSAYQLENGILIENRDGDLDVDKMNGLSRELLAARTERAAAESRREEVEKFIKNVGGFNSLPEVQSNFLIQRIRGDLVQKESELSQISGRLGQNHPEYNRIRSDVDGLRSKLARETSQIGQAVLLEARKEVQLAKNHEQELIKEMEMEKNRLASRHQSRIQVPALQQEVLIAQQVYEMVLQQYNQSNLESRLKLTNIGILNNAVPPLKRSSPKIKINLIVGFVLGLMLGVGIAIVAEATNPIVRTEDGLDETLGVPLIGFLEPGNYLSYSGKQNF
jgi:polysaccharide biosynthesis transport protein